MRGNYVCALVLGWSYILSARLVELRKNAEDDCITYTEAKATWCCHEANIPDENFSIPIGNVDANVCRWRAAILAGGCGWQATLNRSGRPFYPPWSCHLNHNEKFSIRLDRPAGQQPCLVHPPSSGQAHQYLCNFARFYNVYDQLIAAFLACLTIPGHLRFGAPVTLPKPKCTIGNGKPAAQCKSYIPSMDQLAHFMFLTSIPNAMSSFIFGCFWEPGVHCNVVGAWLHPIWSEILPPLIHEKNSKSLLE